MLICVKYHAHNGNKQTNTKIIQDYNRKLTYLNYFGFKIMCMVIVNNKYF